MRILEFMKSFPDEDSCKEDFRQKREAEGVKCKKCENTRHYWLQAKWQWQCAECDFRTTLRSGTIMEDSKMSFMSWYMAMALMTFSKQGISAKEVQRQIGRKYYHCVWNLMHKIRTAMGKRDAKYLLKDMVEFDEAFFTKPTQKGTILKRGKGSQRQINVAVLAESTPLEDIKTNKKSSACRYFKMKALDDHSAEKINETIKDCLDQKCIVFSDKSKSYVDISTMIETHVMEKSSNELTNGSLKWVHIAITNAKTNFSGTYHKIMPKYLQRYLDEFCYKLNRRYFGTKIFDRVTVAITMSN